VIAFCELDSVIALEEAHLPYTVRHVDLHAGQQRQLPFLALNPRGQVPVLVRHSADDPFVLTQSSAITMFAAACAPDALLPGGSQGEVAAIQERFFFFVTDVIAVSHAAFVGDHNYR
jgi:GST-like protein